MFFMENLYRRQKQHVRRSSRKAPDTAVKQNVLLLWVFDHNLGKQIAMTDTSLRIFLFRVNIAVKHFARSDGIDQL